MLKMRLMRMMRMMMMQVVGEVQEPQRYLTGCTHRLSNPIAFALPDTDIY